MLVNNAGEEGEDIGDRFLKGIPLKAWERTIDINLRGAIHCTMALLPHMIERKYGKIANISSQEGWHASELDGPYR